LTCDLRLLLAGLCGVGVGLVRGMPMGLVWWVC